MITLIVIFLYNILTIYIRNDTTNPLQFLSDCDPLPTLILLDIHIKPNNGYSVLNMIRNDSKFKDIKVIALTASFMKEDVGRMKSAGFDGGIAKPINKSIFPSLLKKVIEGDEVWHISTGSKSDG